MLEQLFQQVAKEVGYSIYPGASIEIQDLLGSCEGVVEYEVTAEDQAYLIRIKLARYDRHEARRVFRSLVQFVAFDDACLYVRRVTGETIEYSFLTATDDGLAFRCEVVFAP